MKQLREMFGEEEGEEEGEGNRDEETEAEEGGEGKASIVFSRMRKQGAYSLYNPHSKYPFIFALEPYVVFALGLVITAVIVIRSLANGDAMSKDLSILWILISLYIIISTGAGTYFSEKAPEEE